MQMLSEAPTNDKTVLKMRGGIEHDHHGTELCRKYSYLAMDGTVGFWGWKADSR